MRNNEQLRSLPLVLHLKSIFYHRATLVVASEKGSVTLSKFYKSSHACHGEQKRVCDSLTSNVYSLTSNV